MKGYNREPDVRPCTLSFHKDAQTHRKDSCFQQMVLGKLANYPPTAKTPPKFLYLSTCTKINSKWTQGLNLRPETLKLLGEKGVHWGQR